MAGVAARFCGHRAQVAIFIATSESSTKLRSSEDKNSEIVL
jgi:hypothetical protein